MTTSKLAVTCLSLVCAFGAFASTAQAGFTITNNVKPKPIVMDGSSSVAMDGPETIIIDGHDT